MDTAGASKKIFVETFNKAKSNQLNELRKENEFCDLTLKCEDGFEIKVHRVVVSSASNYFKDLLTLPMKEKFEESISMPDITGDVLEKIIMFIYTSELEDDIEDIEKIIKYAVIFQLQALVEICLLTLNKSINDYTCVKYWRLGRVSLIYDLEENCLAYIVSKADHLFESSLMSDLTIEEMRFLLADNRLHLQCDERKIFEHVWKWAESKISANNTFSQIFSEVVDLFNYAELKQEFILSRIFFSDDLTDNAEILQKIIKVIKQKYKEFASLLIFPKPTQRRLLGVLSNKMFIGLGEESTIVKEVNLRCNFGYTTFDNKLLICGGENSNSCEFFDPSTEKWKEFPSMKGKKSLHRCSYLDKKIYACGGIDSKTVEIFDSGKEQWDYGPKMLADNCRFGLSEVNGALYAIGGATKNVEILDPRTQKWNVVCSDSRIHQYVCCVSIGPCIYCFTGDKRYIFDTRSNQFSEEILTGGYRNHSSICELNGYFHYLGYQEELYTSKYSLNHIQYHLDGKQGLKKWYGLYNKYEVTQPAIVSLYY